MTNKRKYGGSEVEKYGHADGHDAPSTSMNMVAVKGGYRWANAECSDRRILMGHQNWQAYVCIYELRLGLYVCIYEPSSGWQ